MAHKVDHLTDEALIRYKRSNNEAKLSYRTKAILCTLGAILCAGVLAASKSIDALAPGELQKFPSVWRVLDNAWHYTFDTWWPNQVKFTTEIVSTLCGKGTGITTAKDVLPRLENIVGDAAFLGHCALLIGKWRSIREYFRNRNAENACNKEISRRGI